MSGTLDAVFDTKHAASTDAVNARRELQDALSNSALLTIFLERTPEKVRAAEYMIAIGDIKHNFFLDSTMAAKEATRAGGKDNAAANKRSLLDQLLDKYRERRTRSGSDEDEVVEDDVLNAIDVFRSLLEACGCDNADPSIKELVSTENKPRLVAASWGIFAEWMAAVRSEESCSVGMESAFMKGLDDLERLSSESETRAMSAKCFACCVSILNANRQCEAFSRATIMITSLDLLYDVIPSIKKARPINRPILIHALLFRANLVQGKNEYIYQRIGQVTGQKAKVIKEWYTEGNLVNELRKLPDLVVE